MFQISKEAFMITNEQLSVFFSNSGNESDYEEEKRKKKQKLVRNEFERSGRYGMPLIKKQNIELDKIELLSYLKIRDNNDENKNKTIHFFTYDWNFDAVYEKPEQALEKLDKYYALLTPEFSTYKDMPLATKEQIKVEDLWDVPLLISRHSNDNNFITNWLGKNFSELNVVATYNLIFNAALMVKDKIGYALTLKDLYNTNGTDLLFKPITPHLTSKLHIAWKKYAILTKPAQLFLEYFDKNLK